MTEEKNPTVTDNPADEADANNGLIVAPPYINPKVAAGGTITVSGAFVIWLASQVGVSVPEDVALELGVLVGGLLSFIAGYLKRA